MENSLVSDQYIELYSSFGFENLIDNISCVTDKLSSCNDHLLYKGKELCDVISSAVDNNLTDHRAIAMFFSLSHRVVTLPVVN